MIVDLQTNKEGIASEEFLPLVLFDEDLVDFTKGLIENKHAFMRGPIVIVSLVVEWEELQYELGEP